MPKHREEAEKENNERWLITYADLITLLLVFFIVMYAMGKVDLEKFKKLSDSLGGSMGGILSGSKYVLDEHGPTVIPGMMGSLPEEKQKGEGESEEAAKESPEQLTSAETRPMTEEERIEDVEAKVVNLIKEQNLGEQVTVVQEERGLSIMLNDVLFNSGSAELTPEAMGIISRIAKIIEEVPNNDIRIEGHTDNIPIHNFIYPSNYELSAARAAAVRQHIFRVTKVHPERFSIVGYGEYRPIASNDTPEGRSANRRVTLMILRNTYNIGEAPKSVES